MITHRAKQNLVDYSIAIDPEFQDTWFHEVLATILQSSVEKIKAGEDVRIIVEAPPRHGKSYISTQMFTSWVLGQYPSWPIAVASYSGDLAVKFGQQTRDIMESSAYQEIFDTRLNPDSKAKGYWRTQEGGSYMSAGAGGAFSGTGFKIGIIDDLFKNREEADSEVIREARWDWYRSTFYTRQEGITAIIIINTRWHQDDLIGRLLELEKKNKAEGVRNYDKWTRIKFPAIAVEDEQYRKRGEPLWPEKFPISKLRTTENALGPYEWSALYQANPIASELQEFKEHWINRRTWLEVESLNTRKFATIDPGGKETEHDYTGITRNYIDSHNNWNIKCMRVHFDSRELINHIFKLHEEGFEKIGIEKTVYLSAIEPFFKEETLKRDRFPEIVPLSHHKTQKEIRIRGLIPRYSNGQIYHIDSDCVDLEREMVSFPKGAHDDALDSLAMQLEVAESPVDPHKRMVIEHEREQRRGAIRSQYGL